MDSGVGMRRQLSWVLPAALSAAVIASLFGRLLRPSVILASRDIPFLHLPLLADLVSLARQGIPYWNPLLHGGQPLLSNPHYAAFYPPIWLALLIPPHYTISLLVVFHAVWASVGAWRLARHWGCEPPAAALAAMVFAGGGAFSSSPSLLNLFFGLAWLPWAMLWGDQALHAEGRSTWLRAAARTALALGAQTLTGSPVTPVLSVLALACLALECLPRQPLRTLRLVAIGLVALALGAVQLVPTVRYLSESPRAAGFEASYATSWSTPPLRFLEWLWPRIYGNPRLGEADLYFGYPGNEHTSPFILSIYGGFLALALGVGALTWWRIPRRRALLAMLALGIFLALGRFNPLYHSVIIKTPPFSIIRFPEKFVLLSTTSLAFIAALGWDHLLKLRRQGQGLRLAMPLTLAAIAVAGSLILLGLPWLSTDLTTTLIEGNGLRPEAVFSPHEPGDLTPEVMAARAGYLGREVFIALLLWIGTLLLLTLHRSNRIPQTALVLAVLAFVGLDLWHDGHENNPTSAVEPFLQPPEHVKAITPEMGRLFSDDALFHQKVGFVIADPDDLISPSLRTSIDRLVPYTGNLWGLAYAMNEDFDLMLSRWAFHALRTFHLQSQLGAKGWTDRAYRYLGVWNVGVVARRRSPEALLEEQGRTGTTPVPVRLVSNPFLLPRLRLMPEVHYQPDLAAAVEHAAARDFDLAQVDVVVGPPPPGRTEVTTYCTEAGIVSMDEHPTRIAVEYQSTDDCFLVAAITQEHDWRARIDGQLVSIAPTALGQMGIELPAGRHRLELRHRDPSVAWGAILTLVALVGCVIAQRPRRMPTGD